MDTTDPEITFDEQGFCNNCTSFLEKSMIRIKNPVASKPELLALIDQIKRDGHGKQYDCLIGVSGGTDSTYVAYLVKRVYGLRPIAVHLDNGWDSELAVKNIENILNILGIDLYTHVIDWREFKDLQLSFLKASTSDIDIPTDHAISALMYLAAEKFGVKYILSGSNFNDEGAFPESWAYGHLDWKYIRGIHRSFGSKHLRTFPHISLPKLFSLILLKRIRLIAIMNYIAFEKTEAQRVITSELGWRNYGGKHYESIYTRFMQSSILPKKFDIDVRKAYWSSLILRGQMRREDAIARLEEPIDEADRIEDDKNYFLKKMEMNPEEFQAIMDAPVKRYTDYPSHAAFIKRLRRLLNTGRRLGLMHS
jgi:N-acetyl sugar amidotransferase